MEMIQVKNEWEWVDKHIDQELNNEELLNDVLEFATTHKSSILRLKEAYLNALNEGIENNQFLSFRDWFHIYKTEIKI